jgi:glutathione S-transferase
MGNEFTLADLNFVPFAARLDALCLLPIWFEARPHVGAWWERTRARPSYAQANVGPAMGEEMETYNREGQKIVDGAAEMLAAHKAGAD